VSSGKRTSLIAAAALALLVALGLGHRLHDEPLLPVEAWGPLAAGLLVGVTLAAALAAIVGTILYRGLDELIRQVRRRASRPAAPEARLRPRFWLRPLARVIEHGFRRLHRRAVRDRRAAELARERVDAQRRLLDAAFAAFADPLLITDGDDTLRRANPAACRALGLPMSFAPAGSGDAEGPGLPDEALRRLIREARRRSERGQPRTVEHRLRGPDGEAWFDVTATPLADEVGEVRGVLTVMRRREAADEAALADRRDMVFNISHELRTPLSSINAYVEMLLDGEAEDEADRAGFYRVIQTEATRLGRLIDNVLELNRLESGALPTPLEPVDLHAVIAECMERLAPQARARRIALRQLSCPLGQQVHADYDLLCQALVNVVGNAVKYTPEGGRIELGVEVDEARGCAGVVVRDSGVGIPPEALPRIFEKFYRVPEHRKLAPGTGLGLNLVKQIVEKIHGGRIAVRSQPGHGAAFTLWLPVDAELDAADARSSPPPLELHHGPCL
jgi:two-component system phosphate regulon sensor histidine kinase PhoR